MGKKLQLDRGAMGPAAIGADASEASTGPGAATSPAGCGSLAAGELREPDDPVEPAEELEASGPALDPRDGATVLSDTAGEAAATGGVTPGAGDGAGAAGVVGEPKPGGVVPPRSRPGDPEPASALAAASARPSV